MSHFREFIFACGLLLASPAIAHPQQKGMARGELLYTTHCSACHSTEVHWRKLKRATDWSSLVAQVRRWQVAAGLRWSQEEINDVARYLNAQYYEFQSPEFEGYSQRGKPGSLVH